MDRFTTRPLILRHGQVAFEFFLYPPQEGQSFYMLPVPPPRTWKQRLLAKMNTPFKPPKGEEEPKQEEPKETGDVEGAEQKPEEKEREKEKVLPYEGGVTLHPMVAWELYRNIALLLEGELDTFHYYIIDDVSRDPTFSFRVPKDTDKAVLYLIAESTTKRSKTVKRGRIGFTMQEAYSFMRYMKTYMMMELVFIHNGHQARFFRWTEDYFYYDACPASGAIQPPNRERLLQMLADYLSGKDVKPLSVQNRVLFKVDHEQDSFLIIPIQRPPIMLTPEQAKDLYLFLK